MTTLEGRKSLDQFYQEEKYVVVTAVSSHRIRYVMKIEDLQNLNTNVTLDEATAVEWALDTVTMQECDEFSQDWLGEQIVDTDVISKDEMLELFDRDNNYLKEWTTDYKIEHVRKCLKGKEVESR